ncbi:toxin-antitoxin system YwqK family antitoxin [Fusobacterium polymorphum]
MKRWLVVILILIMGSLTVNADTLREVGINDTETKNNLTYVKGENEVFTGIVKGKLKGLFVETPYKDGKINGVKKIYYNGVVRFEFPFIDGEMNGIGKEYYSDGTIRTETPYKNNKPNGVVKTYDVLGNLESEVPFTDNEIDGVAKYYRTNGKLRSEISYKNGILDGVHRVYNEFDGSILGEEIYKDGKKIGEN